MEETNSERSDNFLKGKQVIGRPLPPWSEASGPLWYPSGDEVSGRESHGKWGAPGTAASPSGSLSSRGASCLQLCLWGRLLGWDPLLTLCQELDFICLHIWGMHAHTCMCLSRVHACGTDGIYGAQ